MKLKHYQKNILFMLVIVGVGYILFNIAFILAAFVLKASMSVLGMSQNAAPPFAGKVLYLLLILLISWFVFRSKLSDLAKATFLTMPLMVVLVMVGIFLNPLSRWLIVGSGAVIVCTLLFYLYMKKLSWLYYFATIYVAVLGVCIMIFNVQI